jgi:hypothetical protein
MKWEHKMDKAVAYFPAEPLISRKTKLYLKAIQSFGDGKYWEKAIELLKELRSIYEPLHDWSMLTQITVAVTNAVF